MSDDPASKDAMRWEIRRSLVERLRIPWEGMGEMANQQRAEAAVQISTMMDEIEAWRQAVQKAERDIAQLRDALEVEEDAVNHLHTDRNNLRLEIDRMVDKLTAQRDAARRERDEARREACRWMAEAEGGTPVKHSVEMGWFCFGEKS
jgi:septal ring factor EnvC (AmiA/AmiB activator)